MRFTCVIVNPLTEAMTHLSVGKNEAASVSRHASSASGEEGTGKADGWIVAFGQYPARPVDHVRLNFHL